MKNCKVFIILAIALLFLFGCTPGNTQSQETTPKDTEAMKEAENVYTQYLTDNSAEEMAEHMLYDGGSVFVLLRNGDAVAEYESKDAALQALKDDPKYKLDGKFDRYALFYTKNDKLFICKQENRFMHISFDDTAASLLNLNDSKYNSLFEEPFFKWLKGLHDSYGAKFSLYVFADCLSNVTDRFAAEFTAASDWLKLGLHSPNNDSNYKSATYDFGKQEWNNFVANILRITGSEACIDRIPRLHNFAGKKEAVLGMRDANCGALGFLAADDTRASYYLNTKQSGDLYKNDHITDYANGLVFLTTERRAEDNAVYSTGLYKVLEKNFADENNALTLSSCIIFTHETTIYDAATGTFKGRQTRIEDACRFAYDNGIAFAYPQEVELSASEYDIHK